MNLIHDVCLLRLLGQTASQCMSNGVLQATTQATLKLFLVCGFIGWLLSTGRLSEDTAPVLSKARVSKAHASQTHA